MARFYKIALDTNTLLYVERFKIDVFTQLKEMYGRILLYVPEHVMRELEILSQKGPKFKKQINLIKILLKKHNVRIKNISALNADEALLKLAQQGIIIATNDKALRNKIKDLGGKVLIIRQKKFVEEF